MPTKDRSCKVVSLFNAENGEKIGDINSDSINLSIDNEFETDYAKDKNGNKFCSFTRQKSKIVTFEFNPSVNKIDYMLGIDKLNVPDEFSLQILIEIQNRKHRKKRINKKWSKRYGNQYKYIDMGKYNIKNNDKDKVVMVKKF